MPFRLLRSNAHTFLNTWKQEKINQDEILFFMESDQKMSLSHKRCYNKDAVNEKIIELQTDATTTVFN